MQYPVLSVFIKKRLNMKSLIGNFNNYTLKIEEDLPEVGAYLYVYKGSFCTHDFLQNNIEMCKKMAFEDYGVPFDIWILKEK